MRKARKTAIALGLAAVMSCGVLAGCDLVTTDGLKDLEQVVAEVNITSSEEFSGEGKYAGKGYENVIKTSQILKRDLVASYMTMGSTFQNYYGYSYADTFDTIVDTLVNSQIFLQYAQVYFFEYGSYDEEGNHTEYKVSEYTAAVSGEFEDETARDIAGLAYFLTKEEQEKADYDLRVSFNNTLDSSEPEHIKSKEDEHDHDNDIRTTPTGVEKEDKDFYLPRTPKDGGDSYAIYTGINHLSECGIYEAVEGSTATSRKNAYADFLSNLSSNNLLLDGENVRDIESLSYYRLERKNAYETAVINKLTETLTYDVEQDLKANDYQWVKEKIASTYAEQKAAYEGNNAAFESQLDSVSDNLFLFYAPDNYGFVINILLPFSKTQSARLTDAENDENKSTKFEARAKLLQGVKATDQRGTWFTGHDDYSFEAGADAYKGTLTNQSDRKYLFFEDSLAKADGETGTRYQPLKNYYGQYTYNGKVTKNKDDKYVLTPKPITVNQFIDEMQGYLNEVLGAGTASGSYEESNSNDYFTRPASYYYKADGSVDYEKFLYYQGKVDFSSDGGYDHSQIFKFGSKENKAFSVIKELSFAYNTDTAGLNTYLGYSVSPETTNFVKEFEAAAQIAVEGGAGTYTVAPSDYGWHIMYCTFSFAEYVTAGGNTPFYTFVDTDAKEEGTFSYLYYEALKSSAVSTKVNNLQTELIGLYVDCATIWQERYEDFRSLGN